MLNSESRGEQYSYEEAEAEASVVQRKAKMLSLDERLSPEDYTAAEAKVNELKAELGSIEAVDAFLNLEETLGEDNELFSK